VLDFNAVVDDQAGDRHVPGFIVAIGKHFSAWRFDFDWDAVDHLARVEEIDVPVLLFHGTDDDRAPVAVSRRFAAERDDIVTYVEVEGAGHVRSWNAGPEAYQQRVRQFLEGIPGVVSRPGTSR
jgi:pimeloyl-ACP methyl ester carboxylesterase